MDRKNSAKKNEKFLQDFMDIEIWKYYKCQVLRKIVCKVI